MNKTITIFEKIKENNVKHTKDTTSRYTTIRRPIIKTNPQTGQQTRYKSIKEASDLNNVGESSIWHVANNRRKTAAGCYWKYATTRKEIRKPVTFIEGEIWKPIENTFNIEVSNYGRIKKGSILLSIQENENGNRRVDFTMNGVCKSRTIHYVVAKAFIANPLNFKKVMHLDGDNTNNNVDNLRWIGDNKLTSVMDTAVDCDDDKYSMYYK